MTDAKNLSSEGGSASLFGCLVCQQSKDGQSTYEADSLAEFTQHLRKHGQDPGELRVLRAMNEEDDQIIACLQAGVVGAEVAQRFGISRQAVHQKAIKYGLVGLG